MTTDISVTATRFAATGPEHCIAKRDDGVYADPSVLGTTLVAAIDNVYRAGNYFTGIDYPVLMKALFGHGPELPQGPDGTPLVRFAADIQTFDPARRALYRAVKIGRGYAEYYFEPVWLPDPADPDAPGFQTRLDLDEFIADVWIKGIRFGLDLPAIRAAMESTRADRVTVARQLEPRPGEDAHIVEVSDDLHRSDAPLELGNGRLDLNSFQNRFPQIQAGVRLLKKVPATAGAMGFEMSGAALPPEPGRDVDLPAYAGTGTKVERTPEGEFLVSSAAGFLMVDAKTSRISVEDKVVSHDGVSAKTTGNLSLTGDYEEFGEVQEKRVIEADSITVHGDVFGSLVSRGGTVDVRANLVGGSARNARGDIHVRGVASASVLCAEDGRIVVERAENCVIAGTRVEVNHAVNCEIVGDEVVVNMAEGCALAGRRVTVECTVPRKQSEMLVAVLREEGQQIDEVIAAVTQRVAQFATLAAQLKAAQDALTGKPDVRRYLMLATRVRKGEISLTPEQARQFQKMAQDVGPALKAIGDVSAKIKAAEAEQQAGTHMLANLQAQRGDAASISSVAIASVQGETQVRILAYSPAGGQPWRWLPREIRTRLRGPQAGELLFMGGAGSVAWSSDTVAAS
ncbi:MULTISPECIES: flagellar assembly protein A [unclassified Massilia]|uniref:flagellar assembly protein A n=1 Tax=unclassified Massilia TaxID=2609279 RepID=UPI000A62F23A|nr:MULTISPECIES: flagellar assembly protein A [unclassified Massilia]